MVSLATGTLSGGMAYYLKIEQWWAYALFGFLSTMGVYNGQRLFKAQEAYATPWIAWVKQNSGFVRVIVAISISAAGSILVFFNLLSSVSAGILIFTGVISAFYVIKINGVNMRELPHLKIHLIALTWSLVLIVLPAISVLPIRETLWIAVAHYFYVLGVTIPFDIRDLKYDLPKQRTIPQLLGVVNSKIVALFCLILFSVMMMYMFSELHVNILFYVAVFTQIFLVLGMNEQRPDGYCAGAIDGAIAILGLSYFMLI